MKSYIYITVALLSALLTSCATNSENNAPKLTQILRDNTGQDGRACVRNADIRGYGTADNKVINIDATRSYYIATVHPGCLDLQTSMGVMFSGSFSEVCGGRIDKIITSDGSCTIDQVFEFENREQAFSVYEEALAERASYNNE